MQEVEKSKKDSVVLTLELPNFPHAVMYHQTVVGPPYQGAIEDPSSPSASLLPLYDPEVKAAVYPTLWTFLSFPFLSFPFLSFPFLSFPFLSFPYSQPCSAVHPGHICSLSGYSSLSTTWDRSIACCRPEVFQVQLCS